MNDELDQSIEDQASPEAAEEQFSFAEDPAFDIDYKGECAYEVRVTVPVVNLKNEADKMFADLKKEVEMPGFRRGRAPLKLLERKFSKMVQNDVERTLVSESFKKLMDDEDISPIDMPDVEGLEEEVERSLDEPLTFTLKFEVTPKVELGKYRGIEVEKPVLEVTDKEVDEAIDEMRTRAASFETLEEDAKAEEGDQVIIDFEGKIDGEVFPGGSAENYPYVLGSKRFLPEFEENLASAKAGDSLQFTVEFPEDYGSEELAGKQAEFSVTVNELKRRKNPELDDDFAKQAGFESIEDMREKTRDNITKQVEDRSRSLAQGRAMKAIVDDSRFEIPPTLVKRIAQERFEQRVNQLRQMHMPAAQIEQMEDGIRQEVEESARTSIKSMVVLNEVAEAEGVEVTEEDFDKEAEGLAARYDMDVSTVSTFMSSDEQRSEYEDRILRTKTMDLILDSANIVEKKMSREEFEKQTVEGTLDESAEKAE